GTIGLPLVPVRLRMAGLTEIQAQQKIAEVLEANGLISHPQVIVSVKEKKSKPITIVGAVVKPMVYEADRPVSLVEALAEAGGIANDAGDSVMVWRPEQPKEYGSAGSTNEPPEIGPEDVVGIAPPPGGTSTAAANPSAEPPVLSNTITVNLNDLLETGDTRNNIPLQGGDIVTVPHAGIVYVLGAVSRPGG